MCDIELPPKVQFIITTLEQAGFEAYAVGGCVRDCILGRIPQDWDITTSAQPWQVKELFPRTIDTGIQHGTVTIRLDGESFEVTTYRIDGTYEDARHPREVLFTANLKEDLRRRDFTVNAMAYNERTGLVDAFDGLGDIRQQLIRCVGNPRERFGEDALRMLRAVRFSAQLGFALEADTRAAITELAANLKKISAERIQTELVKLLLSPNPEEVRTLYTVGISSEIFPWLDDMMATPQNTPYHSYSVGEHTIHTLSHVPPDKTLRLAMLLHDIAKPACRTTDLAGVDHFKGHPQAGAAQAKRVLRELKFDNDTIDKVTSLILWHDDNPTLKPATIRRAMRRIGPERFHDLFAVKRADTMGKSGYRQEERFAYIDEYEKMYQEILQEGQCVSVKDLAVKGADLIAAGFKPGPALGEMLEYLLEQVMEHPEYNTREILLEISSKRE